MYKYKYILVAMSIMCVAQSANAGPGCDVGTTNSAIDFIENLSEDRAQSSADFILHVPVCATNLHKNLTALKLTCQGVSKNNIYAFTELRISLKGDGAQKTEIDDLYEVELRVRDKFPPSEIEFITCDLGLRDATNNFPNWHVEDYCEKPDPRAQYACLDKNKPKRRQVLKKINPTSAHD